MSVGLQQMLPPDQINRLLAIVFQAMAESGDHVLKPFLQDVVQFVPLVQTLIKTGLRHPGTVLAILPQVGALNLLDWMQHLLNLGFYTVLYSISPTLQPWIQTLPAAQQYVWNRRIQAWQYGSGSDYQED
jgi:lycopene cyclase CruP